MKILVLGGTMFFGKKLVTKWLENGAEVTIATRGKVADSFGATVGRVIIDRDEKESMKVLAQKEWDIVYDQSCYSPLEATYVSNYLSGKIGKLVFTSSGAVYEFGRNRKEEEFNPYTYKIEHLERRDGYKGLLGYQEAKRAAEAVYFQQNGFPVCAVRFPFVVGEDDYTERLKFHVQKIQNGEVFIIPELDHVLDFITSDDAASFLFWLGSNEFRGPINGSACDDISMRSFITMIEEIVGKSAKLSKVGEDVPTSPYALPDSYSLDSSKAVNLGYDFPSVVEFLPKLISKSK